MNPAAVDSTNRRTFFIFFFFSLMFLLNRCYGVVWVSRLHDQLLQDLEALRQTASWLGIASSNRRSWAWAFPPFVPFWNR